MRRHISDTRTMHRKIYQVHPHSCHMLFVDMSCQAAAGCPAAAAAKICGQTYTC